MHDIAQSEAIRLNSLMELNWLETGMQPAPGETLSLAGKIKINSQISFEIKLFFRATHYFKNHTLKIFKMPLVKIHDKSFETYLSEETISKRIDEMAAGINKDYAGNRPLFISILNGSFMFAADLFKRLTIEAELCFIKLVSYKGMKSTGKVVTSIGLEEDIFGKDIIIVEDM
jgi:hypothetical protein